MILGFDPSQKMTEFANNGEQAVEIIKNCFSKGDHHKFSLIMIYCNNPLTDELQTAKTIRHMYQQMDIPTNMQPKIVGVTKTERDLNVIQNETPQNGMDTVYPNQLPINEFGQLLVSVKSIDGVPEHLTEDEAE